MNNIAAGKNKKIKVFVIVKLIPLFLLLCPLIRLVSLKPLKHVLVKMKEVFLLIESAQTSPCGFVCERQLIGEYVILPILH